MPYYIFSEDGSGKTANNVIQYLLDSWNWRLPRLVVSVAGDSENLVLPLHLQDALGRGLRQVVETSDAWVVTGGTGGGLINFVGRALLRAQDAVESDGAQTQLIGFARAQDVMLQQKHYSPSGSKLLSPESLSINDYQAVGGSTLEENHGMFILVDNPFVNQADGAVWQHQDGGKRVHQLTSRVNDVMQRGLLGMQERWASLMIQLTQGDDVALHCVQLASRCGTESSIEHLWSTIDAARSWSFTHQASLQVYIHLIVDEDSEEETTLQQYLREVFMVSETLTTSDFSCQVATVMDRRHALNHDGDYAATQVAFDAMTQRDAQQMRKTPEEIMRQLDHRTAHSASRDLPIGPYTVLQPRTAVSAGQGRLAASTENRTSALRDDDCVCFLNLDPFGMRQLYYAIAVPAVRREFMNGLWRASTASPAASMTAAPLLHLCVRTLVGCHSALLLLLVSLIPRLLIPGINSIADMLTRCGCWICHCGIGTIRQRLSRRSAWHSVCWPLAVFSRTRGHSDRHWHCCGPKAV